MYYQTSLSEHDKQVKKLAYKDYNHLSYLKVDLPGYEKPDLYYGFRPDITGDEWLQSYIIEVEVDLNDHCMNQLKAFNKYAEDHTGYKVLLFVPQRLLLEAKIGTLGLKVEVRPF